MCGPNTQNGNHHFTGNIEDRRTVFVTTSAEVLGMPAALTAGGSIGGSATLESSLSHLWNTLVSSNATFMMLRNTGVASMMAEDCGLTSITAGGSGVAAIL